MKCKVVITVAFTYLCHLHLSLGQNIYVGLELTLQCEDIFCFMGYSTNQCI